MIAAVRASILKSEPLIPADRAHVLDALDDLLDAAEHDLVEARAWLGRMGALRGGESDEQVQRIAVDVVGLALVGELKAAAMLTADAVALSLCKPRGRRASR
jgi:hypothetical protein